MSGNDRNTVLLCHFDGADAATTTIDSSASGHTLTANGNVQLDTAAFKFGSAASLHDGAADYWVVSDGTDLDLGASGNPFSIDLQLRPVSTAGFQGLFNKNGGAINWNTTNGIMYELAISSSTILFEWNAAGSPVSISGAFSTTGSFTHIAITYDGTNIRLFIGGTLAATSGTVTGITAPTTRNIVEIGRLAGIGDLNGWIDELRVSDIARWTGAFTPPAAAYSNNTLLFPLRPARFFTRTF